MLGTAIRQVATVLGAGAAGLSQVRIMMMIMMTVIMMMMMMMMIESGSNTGHRGLSAGWGRILHRQGHQGETESP